MGRIRQTYIKRTARELISKHGKDFSQDFKANRELIERMLDIHGKFLTNKITGYVTHLIKRKKVQ